MGHNNTKSSTQIEDFRPRPHNEQPVPAAYVREHPEMIEALNLEERNGQFWERGGDSGRQFHSSKKERWEENQPAADRSTGGHHFRSDISHKMGEVKDKVSDATHSLKAKADAKLHHAAADQRREAAHIPPAEAEHAIEVASYGAVTEGFEAAVLPPEEGFVAAEVDERRFPSTSAAAADSIKNNDHFWNRKDKEQRHFDAPREEWTKNEKKPHHFWQRDQTTTPAETMKKAEEKKKEEEKPLPPVSTLNPEASERQERYRQMRTDMKREERIARDEPWPQEKALDGHPITQQMEEQSWLNHTQRDQRYERQADKEGINWQQRKADAQLDRGVDAAPRIEKAQ